MFDSIDWAAIPTGAELVAGYIDGRNSQWPSQAWTRFANAAALVKICTWGPRHLGNCLDIEEFDSVPSDIPDWTDQALERKANGDPDFDIIKLPILYCSLGQWAECRAQAAGRPVMWWIAHYTGIPHIPLGADACQWGDQPFMTGGPWDLSLCQPWFPQGNPQTLAKLARR